METEDLFSELDYLFQESLTLENTKKENSENKVIENIETKKEEKKEISLLEIYENYILSNDFILGNQDNFLELKNKIVKFIHYGNINDENANFKVITIIAYIKILEFLELDYEILIYSLNEKLKTLLYYYLNLKNEEKILSKLNNYKQPVEGFNLSHNFYILLKYKNIEITNSKGHRHVMPSLIFKISIDTFYFSCDFKVIRDVLTKHEVYSNYNFSHANNDYYNLGANLCFGSSETEINKSFNLMNSFFNFNSSYFKKDFSSLVNVYLNIDTYIRWESIEGTPYRYIENIRKNKEFVTSPITIGDLDNQNFNLIKKRLGNVIKMTDNDIKELSESAYRLRERIKNSIVFKTSQDLFNNTLIDCEITDDSLFYELCTHKTFLNSYNIPCYQLNGNDTNVNISNARIYINNNNKLIRQTMVDSIGEAEEKKVITNTLRKNLSLAFKSPVNNIIYEKFKKKD